MSGICKADRQIQHVYEKQTECCYFSPNIVGCPNVKQVLSASFSCQKIGRFRIHILIVSMGIYLRTAWMHQPCVQSPQGGKK